MPSHIMHIIWVAAVVLVAIAGIALAHSGITLVRAERHRTAADHAEQTGDLDRAQRLLLHAKTLSSSADSSQMVSTWTLIGAVVIAPAPLIATAIANVALTQ